MTPSEQTGPTVGYIGLGQMGGALAKRLSLTYSLAVCDANPTAVNAFAAAGAIGCADPCEVARQCDTVLLCLPTSDHVREVIFGNRGLLQARRGELLIIDQSTGDPSATRAMADELANALVEGGAQLIDAPVSGGRLGAEAGTITIMVGAERDQYERARPTLRAISLNIFHAGGVGSGHVIKLANNLLSGVQRLLSLEAVALAVKNGVEADTALSILQAGGGRNGYLEASFGAQVLTGALNPGFTLGLQTKDLRLAKNLAAASCVPLPFASLAAEFYSACINEMGADAQVDTAALLVDRLAATHIVPDADQMPHQAGA